MGPSTRRSSRQCVGAAFIGILALALAAAGQTPPTPRAWAPEVADAVRAYRHGDYATARRLCANRLSAGGAGGWRGDAALLEALCLLRMPARADRVAGRTELRQLMLADPGLQDDPECNLAYGTAQTALAETGDALEALERAAEGFAARGETSGQAEALIALAEAWARHAEWDATPARFRVQRPANRAAAHATRCAQLEALRSRLAALPGAEEPRTRLELILGRLLVESPETEEEGNAVLARLAASTRFGATAAEAAGLLAQRAEDAGRWAEALRWYDRLAEAGAGETAEHAAQRGREIRQPQIVVETVGETTRPDPLAAHAGEEMPLRVRGRDPHRPGADARPALRLRVRGLPSVDVEVRQVDVDNWLASARPRTSAALLPVSGSIALAREVETRAATPFDWWDSEALAPPLTFAASPGAYVLRVRGPDGTELTRRLMLVSDLEAACLAGCRHVVVWAAGTAGAESATARFWMNRSFQPTEVGLVDGVARFPRPGEAAALRDKGWVCLVRAGEHLALCRGQLPTPGNAPDETSAVVLVSGPPTAVPGESVQAAGLLLPGAGPVTPGDTLELQALDTLERVVFSTSTPLNAGGVFSAVVPVPESAAGEHLRFLARWGGGVPANLAGRPMASIPRDTRPGVRVRFELPAAWPELTGVLTGAVRADYPWGTTLIGARLYCEFLPLQLPGTAGDESIGGVTVARAGRLDEAGRFHFHVPLADFGLTGGPLAVRAVAHVTTMDGSTGTGQTELLVGAPAPHVWLTHEPREPATGHDVAFRLGWYDPAGLAVARPPEVVVTRDEAEVARIPLRPTIEGLTGGPWQPAQPGPHCAAATVDLAGRDAVRISRQFEVAAGAGASADHDAPRCAAHFEPAGTGAVVVATLSGRWDTPLFAVLEGPDAGTTPTGRDLWAVHSLPPKSDDADLRFTFGAATPTRAGWRVLIGRADADGVTWLCRSSVAPDPARPQQLELAVSTSEIQPGQTVVVEAAARRDGPPEPTALMARLIDAVGTGFIDPAVVGAEGPAHEEPWATWLEGVTLWCAGVPLQGPRTELRVPLPDRPGLYKLIALAHAADGAWATDAVLLDARRGVRVAVSTPPRLALGDRAVLAIEIENGLPQAAEVGLQFDPGGGLHVESWRGLPTRPAQGAPGSPSPLAVELPAGGRTWLYAEVEAVRVGAGRVSAEVGAGGAGQRAVADYEVLPVPAPAAPDASIRVQRRLAVWTEMRTVSADESDPLLDEQGGHCSHHRWDWEAWSPTDRLLPGQLVRVQDEIVVERPPTGEVQWSQRVPATCQAVASSARFGRFPGPVAGGPADEIGTNLGGLKPGSYTQEHLLSAVRPGVCLLPPPVLHCGGAVVPIQVEPTEIRLRVVGVD